MKIEFNGWKVLLYIAYLFMVSPFLFGIKYMIESLIGIKMNMLQTIMIYILLWYYLEIINELRKFIRGLPDK